MKNPRMPRPEASKIGHNSIQIPHNGRLVDSGIAFESRHGYYRMMDARLNAQKEMAWRLAARENGRRERIRYCKTGRIKPVEYVGKGVYFQAPTVLYRNPDAKNGWSTFNPEEVSS